MGGRFKNIGRRSHILHSHLMTHRVVFAVVVDFMAVISLSYSIAFARRVVEHETELEDGGDLMEQVSAHAYRSLGASLHTFFYPLLPLHSLSKSLRYEPLCLLLADCSGRQTIGCRQRRVYGMVADARGRYPIQSSQGTADKACRGCPRGAAGPPTCTSGW